MRKNSKFIISLFLSIIFGTIIFIIIVRVFLFNSGFFSSTTPQEFTYLNSISIENYTKDSISLIHDIMDLIKSRTEPYHSSENDNETMILIDTILYSPNLNKIAFFVITKNSNQKFELLGGGELPEYPSDQFHFDAYCFLGEKKDPETKYHLAWMRVLNISNFHSYEEASQRIRSKYFNELASIQNREGESIYKYNLDDRRFWIGPAWEKNFLSVEIYENDN